MTTNLTKIPLLRAVSVRGFATSCPPAPAGGITNYEIKNSTLPNNVVVASAENESPITRISIVFRAGSRNETADNAGVTHTLRICAGLTTKNATQFLITRNIQQVGANLTCTSDREIVAYTLEGTRQAIEKTLPFLTEVATQQVFRPWEIKDNIPRQRLELAVRPHQFRAIDLLHKAAFKHKGLGNSLYSAKYHLGNISSETLQHYVATNFTAGRAAVVGLGVDHAQLTQYAQSLTLEGGEGSTTASPYAGGEIRSDKAGDLAYIAIGGQGAGLNNAKEALAFAVLQRALGVGPQCAWGALDNGPLSKAIGSTTDGASVGAFNASYSDIGLFGALLVAPGKSAGKLLEGVVKVLKGGNLSDADVNRGKNQLKAAILLDNESGTRAIEFIGAQAALLKSAKSPSALAAEVDSVSAADVNAALKKVGSGKLSIASYGNLRSVPYLEDLK